VVDHLKAKRSLNRERIKGETDDVYERNLSIEKCIVASLEAATARKMNKGKSEPLIIVASKESQVKVSGSDYIYAGWPMILEWLKNRATETNIHLHKDVDGYLDYIEEKMGFVDYALEPIIFFRKELRIPRNELTARITQVLIQYGLVPSKQMYIIIDLLSYLFRCEGEKPQGYNTAVTTTTTITTNELDEVQRQGKLNLFLKGLISFQSKKKSKPSSIQERNLPMIPIMIILSITL